MGFRIAGLKMAQFAQLFALSEAELARLGAVRQTAMHTGNSRFPCRVSLRYAREGESLLLLNYEHLPVGGPYRSRYAIYVRENAVEAQLAADEIPEVMQNRPLSLRAFSAGGMLLDADLAQGDAVGPALERLLRDEAADYVHAHNARYGCFVARIDRA